MKVVRNVAIIAAIAAGIDLLPRGGQAADTVSALLGAAFALAIGLLALRFYREYRVAIHGLGDRYRALLYGAIAVGVVTVAAQPRMWRTSGGEIGWFVLVGLVAWALYSVWRYSRSY
jgi:hypothetical protein